MRALPLFFLLASAPAMADVVTDTADTSDSSDDSDKDSGCASAPMNPGALGSVALGALLLVGLRRSQ